MSMGNILDQFADLNVWKQGEQRAPHKPLLVLYALGRWCRGEQGAVPFKDAAGPLAELLKRFGRPRQSDHPEYPFWYLKNETARATGSRRTRITWGSTRRAAISSATARPP